VEIDFHRVCASGKRGRHGGQGVFQEGVGWRIDDGGCAGLVRQASEGKRLVYAAVGNYGEARGWWDGPGILQVHHAGDEAQRDDGSGDTQVTPNP
jgi:hypothetical protein